MFRMSDVELVRITVTHGGSEVKTTSFVSMFLQIHRQNTLCLLDLLIPSLVYRARSFATQPGSSKQTKPATQHRRLKDDPIFHTQMRDKIFAQTAMKPTLSNSKKKQINDALVDVKRALKDCDVVAALERWQILETLGESCSEGGPYAIPESYYKDVASLLCSHLHRMVPPEELGSETEKVVESFALKTATQYSDNDALAAYLLFHLNRNRPQVVIDLYRTFVEYLELATSQPPEPISSDEELADDDDDDDNFKLEDVGRIPVILAATTAYIMTGSFKDAFDIYRTAPVIRIKGALIFKNKFLQRLEFANPTLHAKVEGYFERLELAELVTRPRSLSKRIIAHSHPDALFSLESLYAKVLDGIRASDHYLAAQPSELSRTRLVPLTEAVWASFQTAFIKCERMDLAEKVWSDLSELGIRPGVTMWTALLDIYSDLRNSSRVKEIWHIMRKEGIQPDVLSYRALISVLFDDRRPEEAMRNFGEFQRRFKDSDQAITVYNTVIRGLLSHNRINEFHSVLTKMRLAGPTPDVFSYNTLLTYYARLNDFKALANIVTTMSAAKVSGDVVTYSIILSALLRVGKEDAPTTILNLMRKQGVLPNVTTYSAIIDHQMRGQTEESLQAALVMLDKMERDTDINIKPNVVTYTSILAGVYRGNWLSHKKADELRRNILDRMKKMRVKLNLPTYHILIRASLASPDPDAYRDALAYFQDIEDQGIPRVQNTWYILLTGLIELNKWDVASGMVSKMLKSGHEPSEAIKKLISLIESHQASSSNSIHTH